MNAWLPSSIGMLLGACMQAIRLRAPANGPMMVTCARLRVCPCLLPQGAVAGLRGDMAALAARNERLQRAVAAAQRVAAGTARRADRLLTTVSTCLPLPPDLVGALRRGISVPAGGPGAGPGQASASLPRTLFASPGRGGAAGVRSAARGSHVTQPLSEDGSGSGYDEGGEAEAWEEEMAEQEMAEEEEVAREEREQMFGAALHSLRDLVASFLAALESEARAAGQQQVATDQVRDASVHACH